MSRRIRLSLLVGIGLAVASTTTVRADVMKVTSDGTVYRIDVDPWTQSGRTNGTVLKSTRQYPKGGRIASYIAGTDDAATDRDPALEIDPQSGKPVLVWARNEGSGFNLYVSRFDGSWSTPRLLIKMDGDDLEPQVRIGAKYLHVSWHQDYAGQSTWWRSTFNPGTFGLVFGPERIPTDDAVSVSPDGGPAYGTTEAPADDVFFAATVSGRLPGDPKSSYLWGVRDEPVPFNFRQSLYLPSEVRSVVASEAKFIAGRFTYWFTTADKLYYTTLYGGRWADMRVIELTAPTSTADARLLVQDMLQRLAAGGR